MEKSGKNKFVGTWKLISFESHSEDGRVNYPFGPDPSGYLIFSAEGYLSGAIFAPNHPNWASGSDELGATPEEKIAAVETYFSFCGSYEVQGNKVLQHVKSCIIPN